MKRAECVLLLLLLCVCARRGNVIEIGGYAFLYQGKEYHIQSVTPTHSEGYNILSLREGETLVFKAIDKEQDGRLDEVMIGDMALEDAERIYSEGIAEGERLGYIRKRTFAREYRYKDDFRNYILATYVLVSGEIYNKLIISDRSAFRSQAEVLDSDADGKLDDVIEGTETLGTYQKMYQYVLEKGSQVNRIQKTNGKWIVVQ
jgi:hypothetical protein